MSESGEGESLDEARLGEQSDALLSDTTPSLGDETSPSLPESEHLPPPGSFPFVVDKKESGSDPDVVRRNDERGRRATDLQKMSKGELVWPDEVRSTMRVMLTPSLADISARIGSRYDADVVATKFGELQQLLGNEESGARPLSEQVKTWIAHEVSKGNEEALVALKLVGAHLLQSVWGAQPLAKGEGKKRWPTLTAAQRMIVRVGEMLILTAETHAVKLRLEGKSKRRKPTHQQAIALSKQFRRYVRSDDIAPDLRNNLIVANNDLKRNEHTLRGFTPASPPSEGELARAKAVRQQLEQDAAARTGDGGITDIELSGLIGDDEDSQEGGEFFVKKGGAWVKAPTGSGDMSAQSGGEPQEAQQQPAAVETQEQAAPAAREKRWWERLFSWMGKEKKKLISHTFQVEQGDGLAWPVIVTEGEHYESELGESEFVVVAIDEKAQEVVLKFARSLGAFSTGEDHAVSFGYFVSEILSSHQKKEAS